MRRYLIPLFVLLIAHAALAADYTPDSAAVQREGAAYRYPQAGWIVLHIEGEPYARGYQHGKLLAPEIADYVKCYAQMQSPKAPSEGWKLTRTIAEAMFTRRFDPELIEEMKGICDGANAGGAKFDGRALDLTDIVAINAWAEIMCIDDAMRATPNGLEGKTFAKPQSAKGTIAQKPARCSAFAATGKATKDGKAIIGHITMFDLYACNFYNVWLDVRPTNGHRVVIQTSPGGVQSGMDWYQNDAGMVLTETTIGQTKFNPDGEAIGSRSRRAMQYGDSIDAVTAILGKNGNGLYTNEWLLADMKTNEIAMFELGTKTSKLMRSSKGEWFGNTEGFYWGCNNTKDGDVRCETLAATNDRPASLLFVPEDRDRAWNKLFDQFNGKIDPDFAKLAFSTAPLASHSSCDAKFTTADLAKDMMTVAAWGNASGTTWEPTFEEKKKFSDIKPIVSNPWTTLSTTAPAPASEKSSVAAVDLKPSDDSGDDKDDDDDNLGDLPPAWHGSILPASDGDVWLAGAFAEFNEIVAMRNQMVQENAQGDKDKKELTEAQNDKLALKMFGWRSSAMSAARGNGEMIAPRQIRASVSQRNWHDMAVGRGVMMLAELRRRLGAEKFDAAMDTFGRAHAGKAASSQEFIAAIEQAAGKSLTGFFHTWLDTTDWPSVKLEKVTCTRSADDSPYVVTAQVTSSGPMSPANVDVTIETGDDEVTKSFTLDNGTASVKFDDLKDKPTRLVVNKYGATPIDDGLAWSIRSYKPQFDQAMIVYGTRNESAANKSAADALQKAIRDNWLNCNLPIKRDSEISDDELKSNHLLLIGRPETNSIAQRFRDALPITFGQRSFCVRGDTYAHANSAVIVAGANPMNDHLSIVCIAGLSGAATFRAAPEAGESIGAPVKIMPAYGKSCEIVPPVPKLMHEFGE